MNTKAKKIFITAGFGVLAALFYSLMSALVKIEMEQQISAFMLILWRSVWMLFFIVPLIFFKPPPVSFLEKVRTKRFVLHVVRASFTFVALFFYFLCLRDLSLTIATALYFTIPLFIPFVALVWKKHPLPKLEWIGIIIGFVGVLVIIQPGFKLFQPVVILGLLSGLFASIGQYAVHLLSSTEPNSRINFYYSSLIGIASISFVLLPKYWVTLQTIDFLYFFCIGLLGVGYLFFMTQALKYRFPHFATSFLYIIVVFSIILDWYLWNAIENWVTYLGIFLVIAGVILKFVLHRKEKTHQTK